VFLVSDPDGTLIGVRETRKEANDLICEHAMGKVKREIEESPTINQYQEYIPKVYCQLLINYKVEFVR
jgi:hypothetical protein